MRSMLMGAVLLVIGLGVLYALIPLHLPYIFGMPGEVTIAVAVVGIIAGVTTFPLKG